MTSPTKKSRIARMDSILPLPLPPDQLEEIVDKAKDWALMHGACMRSKTEFNRDALQFAPFILFPSPFPRTEFEKAIAMQTILNELMHKVAHDNDFLRASLKSTIEVDEFTRNLFNIFETVQKEGLQQKCSLGLLRSDYMVHSECCDLLKQVEINTIASSFAALGSILVELNRYVLSELGHYDKLKNLPPNNALSGICNGMISAWELYGNSEAVIMFLIEDVTYNICDQRFHEFEIRKINPQVRVIRRTLTQVAETAKLGEGKKELLVGEFEVAVVYFRAGYEPGHYPSQKEWDARLLMERSNAIKCPSVHYHLAGTKKVQQALARPGVLEKYINDPQKVEAVSEIFTGLYSLDFGKFGNEAVELGLEHPEREMIKINLGKMIFRELIIYLRDLIKSLFHLPATYTLRSYRQIVALFQSEDIEASFSLLNCMISKFVLKPQREGGGNNIYGEDVRDALLKMKDSKERTAWILMDLINPPIQQSYMIRPGQKDVPELVDLVSELGIFGVVIGDSEEIKINLQVGHMLRTKVSTANEGGVAAGLGALDSPYLV